MKNRIKQIRKENNLTQIEFGERIGVKGNTITNYETGLRNPTDAIILSICREFSINEEWLRTGNGEMHTLQAKADQLNKMFSDVNKLDDGDFKRRFIEALSKLSDDGWNALEELVDNIQKNKK